MNPSELALHFLRPWWWLALAPMPLALWMLARSGGGRAALARLADATLLPHLVRDASARRHFVLVLCALAWALAVAALSGPAWQKVATPLYVNGAARVVVLSLSSDMLAQDLKPDRMTRARFAVRDLLDGAGDARTALVAYAGAAFVVAPLTDDKHTVLNFLQALRPDVMPVPGNDAAAGIRQALQLLQQAHVQGGEIVLVTDTADAAANDAARAAHARGVRVDVVGIGTDAGAPVPRSGGGFASGSGGLLMARRDDAALRAVAIAGGGRYVALDAGGGGVAALGAPVSGSGRASRGERAQLWRDGGVWLLPILAVLAALAFRRGWLLVLALCAVPTAMPVAHASTWSSLWSNRDQRALHALQDGDTARARGLATTSGMRGAAEYRSGDYTEAARAFAQGDDARARYNLGNALAKQGEYAKAIAAYRQALDKDPQFADARANLDAVEAWLKQHSRPLPSQGQGQPQQHGQHGPSDTNHAQSQNGKSDPRSGQGESPSSASSDPSANGQGEKPNPSATSQGRGAGPGKDRDDGTTSAAEAERQQRQSGQAAQDLKQALQGVRGDQPKPSSGTPKAFALGQSEADENSRFDASQRALLRAVPDDPGALLRRKFRLEWERRNGGQSQENGQ